MSRAMNDYMREEGVNPLTAPRRNKRIYQANIIASSDNANMDGLKKFAKDHPNVWRDIMHAYEGSPDFRFGDTLLVFCSCVKNGYIKIEENDE